MKLCKDCKYCVPDKSLWFWFDKKNQYRYAMCAATLDSVSGEPFSFCSIHRDQSFDPLSYLCGSEGRFWEPKKGIHEQEREHLNGKN